PRSDCRYLPREHLQQIPQVTQAIASVCSNLSSAVIGAHLKQVSKAWNDKKVEAHHAIIPTSKKSISGQLNRNELNIYELISRQYLIQLYPAFNYEERVLKLEISGGTFTAKSKQTIDLGWKSLFEKKSSSANSIPSKNEVDEELQKFLPVLKKGDQVLCESSEILDKKTHPPKYFTDATLLAAMTGINRFVKAPDIRKILKETDGLGTEATRAGIIELLFTRSYLKRQGKQIHSTLIGQKLIASLPEIATLPDMTAKWESQLSSMAQRGVSYQRFMSGLLNTLDKLILQVDSKPFSELKGEGKKPNFKKKYKSKSFKNKKRKRKD
ncbi:MAG: DNA topoisomerase III, partial [Alcanivoracaceae bacterium]|nr:DNA topoisomerase III [Alcanivoracaceae bacterium]